MRCVRPVNAHQNISSLSTFVFLRRPEKIQSYKQNQKILSSFQDGRNSNSNDRESHKKKPNHRMS